jgi:hypothetical protein
VPNYSGAAVGTEQAVIDGVTEELILFGGPSIRTRAWVHFHSDQQSYRRSRVYVEEWCPVSQSSQTGINRSYVEADDGDQLTFKVVAVSVLGIEAPSIRRRRRLHHVVDRQDHEPLLRCRISPSSSARATCCSRGMPSEELDLVGYEIRMGESWDSGEIVVQGLLRHDARRPAHEPAPTLHDPRGRHERQLLGRLSSNTSRSDAADRGQNFVTVQTQNRDRHAMGPKSRGRHRGLRDPRRRDLREPAVKLNDGHGYASSPHSRARRATRTFWIVAIRAPGIYGDVPEFSTTNVLTPPTRNIVYEKDEGAANSSRASRTTSTFDSRDAHDDLGRVGSRIPLHCESQRHVHGAELPERGQYTAILDDTLT